MNSDTCFKNISLEIIASNADARKAAQACAESLEYPIQQNSGNVSGDVKQVSHEIISGLLDGGPGLIIRGGETTIKLPEKTGRGGRNQHLALESACLVAGQDNIVLLVAATDGSDGPTADAGAIIDGGTLDRGSQQALSARDCLARGDAGTFLAASGDLISTGPTGTNVMDLIIGLKFSD